LVKGYRLGLGGWWGGGGFIFIFRLPFGWLVNPPLRIELGDIFCLGGGWGWLVGWGGFIFIFRLPFGWLVNPPLQIGLGLVGRVGAGLFLFFVCRLVGWLTRPYWIGLGL
jgi:hypothetical protein